jgi:putative uncharacterized protein FNV2258|nr:MAG TPA: hypothetical protein [Caudoviricetes sp.]
MIKAKPRKKREIKINEKQEIVITQKPTDEKIESLKLATILVNISRSCTNHKKIWDREIKENEGIIPFDKLMLISQTRATADKIFAEYFQPQIDGDEGEEIEDNFFYREAVGSQATKCLSGVSDNPALTLDDLKQRLPRGFMVTLGAWARMMKELNTAKIKTVIKNVGISRKYIDRLFKLSNKYMLWIYEEIAFAELL